MAAGRTYALPAAAFPCCSAHEAALGIRCMGWSPGGDVLAVGGYDQVGVQEGCLGCLLRLQNALQRVLFLLIMYANHVHFALGVFQHCCAWMVHAACGCGLPMTANMALGVHNRMGARCHYRTNGNTLSLKQRKSATATSLLLCSCALLLSTGGACAEQHHVAAAAGVPPWHTRG